MLLLLLRYFGLIFCFFHFVRYVEASSLVGCGLRGIMIGLYLYFYRIFLNVAMFVLFNLYWCQIPEITTG